MVFLVTLAKSFENLDRFVLRRWLDNDLLETTCKRVVFFDVLTILVQRRGTDTLDLTTSQCWFKNIGSIDRTFSTTSTNERVQFVDEQDRVFGTTHFVHHGFDAFFELTTVFRTSNHHREVEYHDPFFGQDLRHFTGDDQLGKTLDDRRFSNTRFTQQNRVILGSAAEYLNSAFDFLGSSDDGIQFALFRQFGQVTTKAVQRGCFRFPRLT